MFRVAEFDVKSDCILCSLHVLARATHVLARAAHVPARATHVRTCVARAKLILNVRPKMGLEWTIVPKFYLVINVRVGCPH